MRENLNPRVAMMVAVVAVMLLSGFLPMVTTAQNGQAPAPRSGVVQKTTSEAVSQLSLPSSQYHVTADSPAAAVESSHVQVPGWGSLSITPAASAQGNSELASAVSSLGTEQARAEVPSVPSLSTVVAQPVSTPSSSTNQTPVPLSAHANMVPQTVPTVPQWDQLCGPWPFSGPMCLPPPRDSAAMAYDPNDNYVVMYGGAEQASGTTLGTPLSDTWTYKSGVWTELTPTPSPPPRAAPSFVYDTADSKLLLFGGDNLGGSIQSPSPAAVLHDTWTFSGGKWTQIKPSTSPLGRFGAPVVYDAMDGYVLLFGGANFSSSGTLSFYNDLWSFKGSTWTQLPMQAGSGAVGVPGAGRFQAMAYDSYDGYSVLYDNGASWYYVGGYWYQIASGADPPEPNFTCGGSTQTNCIFGMAYDPLDRYVIFQEAVQQYSFMAGAEQTWAYRAGNWLNVTTASTEIPEQENPAMTYDAHDGYVLYFGGDDPQTINDTWLFPAPLSVTVSTNRSSLDVNQSVILTAAPSGGYPPYSYTWNTPANLGCPSSTSISITCTPSSATGSPFSISLTVTDSASTTSSPATASIKVFADPKVPQPSPSIPTADIGTAVTFTATPSGGTGIFHYAWTGLPTGNGCTTANSSSIGCTPTQQTITYVAVTVKDTNGYAATSSPTKFTVDSAPIVSLQVNRSKLDEHESLLFYANATGGTGVYTFAYVGLPFGCSSANKSRLPCAPSATGGFIVTVYANDTGGGSANSTITFYVYSDPSITSYWFPTGGQVAYANESLALLINYSGGIAPYSNCISSPPAWPSGCAGGLGGTSVLLPDYQPYGTAGIYPLVTNITDSTGWKSEVRFNESIYYPTLVTPPTVLPVHEGFSTNASFSIYSMHGATPMTWWLNDTTRGVSLCGPIVASSYGLQQCTFTPNWNGTDQLNLTVKDALHTRLFVTFTYSVAPSLGSLSFKASTTTHSVNQGGTLPDEMGASTTFSATWRGGNGAYTCVLAENGSATLATQPASGLSCSMSYTWIHAAAYTVTLTVTDSQGGLGGSVSQSLFIDVTSKTAILTFTPSLTTLDAQVNDNLSVTYAGGYPNYTFSWNFGNGVKTSTQVPWVVYAWPQVGAYSATITIADSLGVASSTSSVSITVGPSPGAKSIAVNDGPVSVTGIGNGGSVAIPVGTNATFNVTMQGGLAPYTYTWTVNGRIVDSVHSANLWSTCTLNWSKTGNYTLNVTVTDSQNQNSKLTLTVEVKLDKVGPVSLMVTHLTLDAGMWNNVSLSWSGGWAPFSLRYLIVTPISRQWFNTTSTSLQLRWNGTGTMAITATVVDGFGYTAEQNATFTVNPDMTASCAPTYTGAPLPGKNLTFSLSCLSGGSQPFSYRWIAGNVIVTTGTATLNLGFTQDGVYNVSVNVTDAAGVTVTSKVLKVVVDQLGPLSIRATSRTTDVGVKDNLTLSFSGGIAPFSYHYFIATPTKNWWQNISSSTLELDAANPGNVSVMAIVLDAYGHSVFQNVTITVNSDPSAPCAPTYSGTPRPGSTLAFSLGCLSGGIGPFSYTWVIGGVTKVTSTSTVNFTFEGAGIYNVWVNVTDSLGLTASSKTVQVDTAPSTSPGMFGSSIATTLVVFLVVIVVAIVIGLILYARRKKPVPASGDSDHQPQDDITREIRSRTNGRWAEENSLVQETSSTTGKDHSIVRDRIQLLCENHWLEKQNTSGNTEYRWGGTAAALPQGEPSRTARISEIADQALIDPENAGGVTGADLRARGTASGLVPVPDELDWLACMGDRVQAGKVTVESGTDFDSTVWRLKIADGDGPDSVFGDVRVDSTISFVDSFAEKGKEDSSPVATYPPEDSARSEWAEDGERGPVS